MNHNSKHSHSRIRRTVAAVLIVAALVVFVGVFLIFQCLSFDENGAHVIDVALTEKEEDEPETTEEGQETEGAESAEETPDDISEETEDRE